MQIFSRTKNISLLNFILFLIILFYITLYLIYLILLRSLFYFILFYIIFHYFSLRLYIILYYLILFIYLFCERCGFRKRQYFSTVGFVCLPIYVDQFFILRNVIQSICDFIVPVRLGALYSLFRQHESVYSRKFIDTNETVEWEGNFSARAARAVRGLLPVSFPSRYARSNFITTNVDRITRASPLQRCNESKRR